MPKGIVSSNLTSSAVDKIVENKKRLLGIDYGSKRIGVARTNEEGDMALPYSVIQNSGHILDDILKICTDNDISKIIVGESKDFEQKDNAIMKGIHTFVEQLRKSGKEVILHPEFMTSQQAQHDQGRNDMLDASAATIILQSYLDVSK